MNFGYWDHHHQFFSFADRTQEQILGHQRGKGNKRKNKKKKKKEKESCDKLEVYKTGFTEESSATPTVASPTNKSATAIRNRKSKFS